MQEITNNKVLYTIAAAMVVVVIALLMREPSDTPAPSIEIGSGDVILSAAGGAKLELESEYIVAEVRDGKQQVSAWQVSSGGQVYTLGPASPLPLQGKVNELADITLTDGDEVVIVSGESPLGVSFRANKCSAHLAEYQDFGPSFPNKTTSAETYNLCVERHKGDNDFFSSTWYFYLGASSEIYRNSGEVIKLYDSRNDLLDTLSY